MTDPAVPPHPAATSSAATPVDDPAQSVRLTRPQRARVLAIASEALGRMPVEQLPGSLRRIADFAPARRRRLGADPLASALETDAVFRDRLATQVRLLHTDLSSALESGARPLAADPLDLAALAYLLRPDGWTALIRVHDDHAASEPSTTPAKDESTTERLRAQLARAREDVHAVRKRERERARTLEAAGESLRRKVAELGQQLSAARGAANTAEQLLASERDGLEVAAASADAEMRRLRARLRELEAESAAARRGARESRATGTMRARLLLDTLLDTAHGLRRELALPPVTTAFADTVEAVVPPSSDSTGSAGPALRPRDPALLRELLALPRVHLVVDGYNVTKTAWADAALQVQRERLVAGLGAVVARTGAEVTVVFDGADLDHPPPTPSARGVRVLFSPPGVIADDVIRDLVEVEPTGRPLVVASSDKEVADAVAAAGARPVAAVALVGLLSSG